MPLLSDPPARKFTPFRCSRERSFVVDGMLGKLARWLRIVGYDTIYLRNASDMELLQKSLGEMRILLTADSGLYRQAVSRGCKSFLVKSGWEEQELARISKRFNLKLDLRSLNPRCTKCGAELRHTPRDTIRLRVRRSTYIAYKDFWVCVDENCRQVYWQGSHWKNIKRFVSAANALLRESQLAR